MPNPVHASCCWLIFNFNNTSLQKEDAGGRVRRIRGLGGCTSSQREVQGRRRQAPKHLAAPGWRRRPVRARSIPDRHLAGTKGELWGTSADASQDSWGPQAWESAFKCPECLLYNLDLWESFRFEETTFNLVLSKFSSITNLIKEGIINFQATI